MITMIRRVVFWDAEAMCPLTIRIIHEAEWSRRRIRSEKPSAGQTERILSGKRE